MTIGDSSDNPLVFSGTVSKRNGSYVVELPKRLVEGYELSAGEQKRVCLFKTGSDTAVKPTAAVSAKDNSQPQSQPRSSSQSQPNTKSQPSHGYDADRERLPVAEGDRRTVEIESIGEQGDGVAKLDRGYVVIVPDTELRERVEIEIENATPTVAFARVVDRISYYD